MTQTAAACLIVKDEVSDLAEWVDHHARVGFDQIHVYDNASTDGTTELLAFLSRLYPLVVHPWDPSAPVLEGRTRQVAAYAHACRELAGRVDWLFMVDSDEFLLPPASDARVADLLKRHEMQSAIAINWRIFGSRGHEETAGQLVLTAFDRRAPLDFGPNQHVKMFCRPECVIEIPNPHFAMTDDPAVDLKGKVVEWLQPGVVAPGTVVDGDWRLHHYMTRSRSHWRRRIARRQVGGASRDWTAFDAYDRNDVADRTGVKWAALAKDSLQKVGITRSMLPAQMTSPTVRAAFIEERVRFSPNGNKMTVL